MLVYNPNIGRLEIGEDPKFGPIPVIVPTPDPNIEILTAAINAKAAKATLHLISAELITGDTDPDTGIVTGNTVFTIAGKPANLEEDIQCFNAGSRYFDFAAENVDGDLVVTLSEAPLAGNQLIFIYTEL